MHTEKKLSPITIPPDNKRNKDVTEESLPNETADFAEIEIEYDYSSAGTWANEAARRFFSSPVPARKITSIGSAAPDALVKRASTASSGMSLESIRSASRTKSMDFTKSLNIAEHSKSTTIDKSALRAGAVSQNKLANKINADEIIRAKINEMRSIVGAYPFFIDEGESFYRQAKFMEDFSDCFEGAARYSTYYPHYMHMGYEQLRTYFTWRTKVRQGEVKQTSAAYAFIYIYELLCNIGVSSHKDGLDKLLTFWKEYGDFEPALEKYIPQWIKDYHIYYDLPHSFTEFLTENDLNQYYRKEFVYYGDADDIFALWSGFSNYKITGSKFYRDGNQDVMRKCFEAVFRAICDYCESSGKSFEGLFNYRIRKGLVWKPFQRAVFFSWLKQPDRKVTLPGNEEYFCRDNQWTANIPVHYRYMSEIAGYIIKKTEACLRVVMKYKYLIKVDVSSARHFFLDCKDKGVTQKALDVIIEEAVRQFYIESTRTVVTVKKENLIRIRKEAQGTMKKLTISDDFEALTKTANNEETTVNIYENLPSGSINDGWENLRKALNKVEIEILRLIVTDEPEVGVCESETITDKDGLTYKHDTIGACGSSNAANKETAAIRAFAIENGVMLEVLAAEINEKAAENIGDTILELDDGLEIYQEYAQKVAEMVMLDE